MKKLFTLFLALVAGVGTMFAGKVQIGDLYYNLDATNQTAEVTYKSCRDYYQYNVNWTITTANIPASVTYGGKTYTVTSIGYHAFDACTRLTSVTIPNSVTSIGAYAFWYCRGLTSVTIPNSVTSIGAYAFESCTGLTSVTIGNSVTSIGKYAFLDCSSLTSVTIGNSVTSIGEYAFRGCISLTSPVYNAHLFAFMPTSYSGAYTIPNGIESIAGCAFHSCSGLTSVTIPNSVTSIGDMAFYSCSSLTSVTIPNSVTSIGKYAFEGCRGLTSVTIGNSVTSIGHSAFNGCSSLTSITIPNSVTSIGDWAFQYCSSLTSINIPNSVTSIGDYAFYKCAGLTSVTIPNSVTSIGYNAFFNVLNIEYHGTATGAPWGARVMNGYVEGNLVYEDSTKTTLLFCSYHAQGEIIIPNTVTNIGDQAFLNCTSLTSVTIPNSVTEIGEYAFCNCNSLTSVTIEAETPPTLGDNWYAEEVFMNTNNCPIYVPCNAVNTYKTAWSDYANRIRGNCASYTIKFKNWDGSVLQSTQVEEGQMPQYTGATPTKPDDAQYTYTFSGWTPQIVAATADATYTATYTDTPRNQGVEDVLSDQVQCTKVIRNGQVLILRNGKTYTLQGQEVK